MTAIHVIRDRTAVQNIVESELEKFRDTVGDIQVNMIKSRLLNRLVDEVAYTDGEHWGWDDDMKLPVVVEVDEEFVQDIATAHITDLFAGQWKVAVSGRYSDEDDYVLVGTFDNAGVALAIGMSRASHTFEEIAELDGACGNTEKADAKYGELPGMVSIFRVSSYGETRRYTIYP